MTDAPATPLPLDRQLCYALYGASMAVTRAYKPVLDALGLTYPQYLVLLSLWEEDGLSVGAIASRLALEPSTITPLVKRLEAAALVRRERATDDERRVHVRLTDEGRAMRGRCGGIGEEVIARAAMPPEDLAQLHALATRLRNALSAGERPAPLRAAAGD